MRCPSTASDDLSSLSEASNGNFRDEDIRLILRIAAVVKEEGGELGVPLIRELCCEIERRRGGDVLPAKMPKSSSQGSISTKDENISECDRSAAGPFDRLGPRARLICAFLLFLLVTAAAAIPSLALVTFSMRDLRWEITRIISGEMVKNIFHSSDSMQSENISQGGNDSSEVRDKLSAITSILNDMMKADFNENKSTSPSHERKFAADLDLMMRDTIASIKKDTLLRIENIKKEVESITKKTTMMLNGMKADFGDLKDTCSSHNRKLSIDLASISDTIISIKGDTLHIDSIQNEVGSIAKSVAATSHDANATTVSKDKVDKTLLIAKDIKATLDLLAEGRESADESLASKMGEELGRIIDRTMMDQCRTKEDDGGSLLREETASVRPSLSAGREHSLLLLPGGTVRAWGGDNSCGEASIPQELSDVKAISAGGCFTVALKNDGTITAWGRNHFGKKRNKLSSVPTDLFDIEAVSAGEFHTLALRGNRGVVAWGDNGFGQASVPADLEDEGIQAVAAGVFHSLALLGSGRVVGWGRNNEGQTSVPPNLDNAKAIAAGYDYSVALKDDGTVVVWGADGAVRDVAVRLASIKAIAAGWYHCLALLESGRVVAWGGNKNGEADVPNGLENVVAIAAGNGFSLALKEDGSVVGWGRNAKGEVDIPEALK